MDFFPCAHFLGLQCCACDSGSYGRHLLADEDGFAGRERLSCDRSYLHAAEDDRACARHPTPHPAQLGSTTQSNEDTEDVNPLNPEIARMDETDSEIWNVTGPDGTPGYVMYAGGGSSRHAERDPKQSNNTVYRLLSHLLACSFRSVWSYVCSLLPRRASTFLRVCLPSSAVPDQHTWRAIMGDPIPQNIRGTCSICSITVCIESLHRMEYEQIHGPGSFPLIVAYPRRLTRKCKQTKIFDPIHGSCVPDVLDQVISQGGVPTTSAPRSYTLPISYYDVYSKFRLSSSVREWKFAQLLFTRGPCIGFLWVERDYFRRRNYDVDDQDQQVYRGCSELQKLEPDEDTGPHAVVCYAYRFVGQDLQIRILDNQNEQGPRRWVLLKAFDAFYFISVEPLDLSPNALRPAT